MHQTLNQTVITFAVDDVRPATKPLPECRAHESVRAMLRDNIESCCDYHGMVVDNVYYQPLLAAVYTAFSQHRPLALTPDAVWITIAQGVAHHMLVHGERLRSRFVSHQGKLDLVFECSDWLAGSPENPWPEAFAAWTGQIRDHVGAEIHDNLLCDFSTSGPVEQAASRIVMMDVFERYFHYVICSICGIPTITLEGSTGDWQRLRDKAAGLKIFDMDWWLEHLLPICDQFVRASQGEVDVSHWRGICKLRQDYGGDIINGWIAKLFPYLRAHTDGPCTRRNPIFESGEGFQTTAAPPGLSRVPFTWRKLKTGRERKMEAIGGLLGVSQNAETLVLRPKVGWAVREAEKMDVLLAKLGAEHRTFPAKKVTFVHSLPPDLCQFYNLTAGAELFRVSNDIPFQILTDDKLTKLKWGKVSHFLAENDTPNGHIWYRLAHLADKSILAINTNPEYPEKFCIAYRADPAARKWDNFAAICQCRPETQGKPGLNPVIALSFTELLERLLDSDGRPYWLEPDFVGYGDAEEYTRRK